LASTDLTKLADRHNKDISLFIVFSPLFINMIQVRLKQLECLNIMSLQKIASSWYS